MEAKSLRKKEKIIINIMFQSNAGKQATKKKQFQIVAQLLMDGGTSFQALCFMLHGCCCYNITYCFSSFFCCSLHFSKQEKNALQIYMGISAFVFWIQ